MPMDAFRSCSRFSTTACTETSSAVVGLSRITNMVLSAIARVMLMQWSAVVRLIQQIERQAIYTGEFCSGRAMRCAL